VRTGGNVVVVLVVVVLEVVVVVVVLVVVGGRVVVDTIGGRELAGVERALAPEPVPAPHALATAITPARHETSLRTPGG